MQSNSAAFRLKLGTTNTRAQVCGSLQYRFQAESGFSRSVLAAEQNRKFFKVSAIGREP